MNTAELLAYILATLLIAYFLAATYLGGGYVCPRCGV